MDADAVPQADIATVPPNFDESVVLLDVREDDEWQRGHAPGALHIPMGQIPARIAEIDPAAALYVVCQGGGRSQRVSQYLAQNGYAPVNVSGGMLAWAGAGARWSPTTAEWASSEQPPIPSLGWSDDSGVFHVRNAVERARPQEGLVPALQRHAAGAVGSRSGHAGDPTVR